MTKNYKAVGTQVSLSLLVDGANVRVSFWPVSNYVSGQGGSEFSTASPQLQEALESNPKFGKVFFLVDKNGELVTKLAEEKEDEKVEELAETPMDVVSVGSLADAKSWLVENKGWVPSGRPKKKDIIEVAKSFGVVFNGI